jgi:hypothetical protein
MLNDCPELATGKVRAGGLLPAGRLLYSALMRRAALSDAGGREGGMSGGRVG